MTPLPEVDNFAQITTFALALGVGLALCLLYDLFRILRLMWPPSRLLLFAQDVLYWVLSAVVVFLFLLVRCDGGIRFFAMLGLALGWLACHLTLSRWIYRVSKRLVRVVHRISRWVKRRILRPLARWIRRIFHALGRLLKKLCNILKKVPVFLKKCLQRRKEMVYNQHDSMDNSNLASPGIPARDVNIREVQGSHESRRKKKKKRKPVR